MAVASSQLAFKFLSIQGELMDEAIYEAILPSRSGEIVVLPGHEPMVTLLQPGIVTIRHRVQASDNESEYYVISGGVAEITGQELILLADEAESDRDLLESEVQKAYDRAVRAASEVKDQIEFEEAKRLVSHQAARLKLAGLRRRHHREHK